LLNNIRIVLLHTTHPGNIGATARAMKNMGLERLYLVKPKHFPNSEAEARASGATDILENAVVSDTLGDAIADCQLIIGTSARERSLPLPLLTPRDCSSVISREADSAQIAILFGEERTGLTNEQIDYCHYQVMIPANDAYQSLNLAAAVQIIAYELRIAAISPPANQNASPASATASEMEAFYSHLQQVLIEKKFIDPEQPKRLMPKLRRLFTRARPEPEEVNILRGVISALIK